MELKNKVILIFSAIVLGLAIVVFFLMKEVKKANANAERWEQNYNKPDMQVMTPAEFKEYLSARDIKMIDSLNKMLDLKLKPKNINSYQTIVNNYRDTNIIELPAVDEGDGLYSVSFIDKKECWGIDGYFHVPTKTFQIENRIANDSIFAVEYFTRKNILWVLPWGKKQFHRQLWSTCKGKLSETKIEIRKKPE